MRLAFIGWGAIARTAADLLTDPAVELVAVATRSGSPQDLPAGVRLLDGPEALAAEGVDLVAEAASRASVAQWAPHVLAAGVDFVVSSVSALADADLLESLRTTAAQHHSRLLVQPGALAGVEALAAARLVGLDAVEHRIVKPPAAWAGTRAADLCDLVRLETAEPFFRASAAETAVAFPKNANVAMTTALAGIGPDATTITLVADPAATTNRHELHATGAFGELTVSVANNPLPANPKTSALAAYSLVRTIQNQIAQIVL